MRGSGVSSPTRLAIRTQDAALMTEPAILVAAFIRVEPDACPDTSDLASPVGRPIGDRNPGLAYGRGRILLPALGLALCFGTRDRVRLWRGLHLLTFLPWFAGTLGSFGSRRQGVVKV